jgi:CubicO group peptidase (beta-lactamase class C family)
MRAFLLNISLVVALGLAAGPVAQAQVSTPAAARLAGPAAPGTDNRQRTPLDAAVHQAATAYMQQPAAVGLSIALYRGGKEYFYNYGEVEKGTGRRPTATTYYNMGSVAKTFVATLMAQAVLDKKVQLTDDIRRYLPGQYPNLQFEGHPVRLVDLANHTAGLPGNSHAYPKALGDSLRALPQAARIAYYNRYSADSLLADLHQLRPSARPGTTYRYNNLGPLILQLLLERVYQQPYETLVTRYVQQHYGMRDTRRVLSAAEARRYAVGYDDQRQPQHYVPYTGYWGGTTLSSTPADLLRYATANLAERDPAVRLAHQPTTTLPEGYAVGLVWRLGTNAAGQPRTYHSGRFPGYHTWLAFYPGQDVAVVVLVNDNISQDRVTELGEQLRQALGPAAQ